MCGIVGVTSREDARYLVSMAERMRHRGPDDYGEHFDPATGVALAMRRLSIVDIDGGRQPLANEDGHIRVVFNGEIYNAPELRAGLIAKGHQFRTDHSDTEVLVHLYEDKSYDMLDHLNGMYAFVIYDAYRRVLFAARDRAGIKPLYYARTDGHFAFASEMKCLTVLPWLSRRLDRGSLYHFLSLQFVPAPGSILEDVHKLPAGHWLEYRLRDQKLDVQCYWRLRPQPDRTRTLDDWARALRSKLEEAVGRQTLSDVPIACSLSGGLDSSALVGLLSRSGYGPVRTYSLGFAGANEKEFDELHLARKVAEKWGTEHHEVVIDPGRLLNDLERMVWHLDEPYAGGLPSWYVFEMIADDCKVALTGTGGDELFGNYLKWRIHERPAPYRWLRALRDAFRWRLPRQLRDQLHYPHGHVYHRYFADAVKDALIFGEPFSTRACGTERLLERFWQEARDPSARNTVACIDFQMQLPEEFLAVTDRFSMAHSVEARVPYLDHELVELAFQIPPDVRTCLGDPKYLLKRAIGDLLPAELLHAPKKGFVLPLPLWTRNALRPMIGDLLGPTALRRQGLFAPAVWNTIVEPHLAGKRDFTPQVWTLLLFQLWEKQWLQNQAAVPLSPALAG